MSFFDRADRGPYSLGSSMGWALRPPPGLEMARVAGHRADASGPSSSLFHAEDPEATVDRDAVPDAPNLSPGLRREGEGVLDDRNRGGEVNGDVEAMCRPLPSQVLRMHCQEMLPSNTGASLQVDFSKLRFLDCSVSHTGCMRDALPHGLLTFMKALGDSLLQVSRSAGFQHGAFLQENMLREAYSELVHIMSQSQSTSPEDSPEGQPSVKWLLYKLGKDLNEYLKPSRGVSNRRPISVEPQKLMAYALGGDGKLHDLPTDECFTIGRDSFGNTFSLGAEHEISRVHALVLPDNVQGHYTIVDLGCMKGFSLSHRICGGEVTQLSNVLSKPSARCPVIVPWNESAVVDLQNGCSLIFNPPPCELCGRNGRPKRAPCGHGLLCQVCFDAVVAGRRQCTSCPLCGQHLLWSRQSGE